MPDQPVVYPKKPATRTPAWAAGPQASGFPSLFPDDEGGRH